VVIKNEVLPLKKCNEMKNKSHYYKATITWTGNNGTGTNNYRNYERSHKISIENKCAILGTSDPAFRGDKTKHNPEDLLLSSISSCHMLWYLHLCSENGIVVQEYIDEVEGIMLETENGGGHFSEVTLNPKVVIENDNLIELAIDLHKKANELCFIANSLNFKIHHNPKIIITEKNKTNH